MDSIFYKLKKDRQGMSWFITFIVVSISIKKNALVFRWQSIYKMILASKGFCRTIQAVLSYCKDK